MAYPAANLDELAPHLVNEKKLPSLSESDARGSKPDMEVGPQPLDEVLRTNGWSNHQLVDQSGEQLTHKVVQKGRKGRRLTRNAQHKILRAVNRAAGGERSYRLEELFTYRGS